MKAKPTAAPVDEELSAFLCSKLACVECELPAGFTFTRTLPEIVGPFDGGPIYSKTYSWQTCQKRLISFYCIPPMRAIDHLARQFYGQNGYIYVSGARSATHVAMIVRLREHAIAFFAEVCPDSRHIILITY